MSRRTKQPAIKDRAHRHMREAMAVGYTQPKLCIDYAVQALTQEGVPEDVARKQARRVWNESFEIRGAA